MKATFSYTDDYLEQSKLRRNEARNHTPWFNKSSRAIGSVNLYGNINKDTREACNSMILGSLIRSLSKAGIWPAPTRPYKGASLKSISKSIQYMKLCSLCNAVISGHKRYNFPPSHDNAPHLPLATPRQEAHRLESAIHKQLNPLLEQNWGLDIEEKRIRLSLKQKLEE